MPLYPYEYFCGANVVLELEGQPILEAAGLQLQIQENKVPLYGYSSRLFDAVARGRVLVSGSLIINYIHHDYLYQAIQLGLADRERYLPISQMSEEQLSEELVEQIKSSQSERQALIDEYEKQSGNLPSVQKGFENAYWPSVDSRLIDDIVQKPNPHDSFGGLNLHITFGDRNVQNLYQGVTSSIVQDLYFLGRSQTVKIDEETIVEIYPFFARNWVSSRRNIQRSIETQTPEVPGVPENIQYGPILSSVNS